MNDEIFQSRSEACGLFFLKVLYKIKFNKLCTIYIYYNDLGLPRFLDTNVTFQTEFFQNETNSKASIQDLIFHGNKAKGVGDGYISLKNKKTPITDNQNKPVL